ncbi:hypothetical protein DLJ53_23620 [Acuticoccus sediminis]|uniref:Beta-barrel assembly complex subunit BamF n=1 Tax=Acuticoccus sediminis TaxID=2184697 RepID=A0A8B2NIZ0_9HYPH|nr:hypothetical protein [Acuticoccus sediminis]RAH99504.1 hypothetical protein DLJ53_23620 [Acuticoccus sediminis]
MVRSVLIAASLAVGLSGCNTAYNYFEEEPDPTAKVEETTAFGALLSMGGLTQQSKSNVSAYAPRAPLAMPASSDLPSPKDTSSAEQAVNFPEDHDARILRERSETLAAAAEADEAAARRGDRFLPSEVPEGTGEKRKTFGSENAHKNYIGGRLTRQELKVTIDAPKKDRGMLTEDGAPAPRVSLVQPPTDLRTPADTAALPEKKDIDNSEWLKDRLYAKRREADPGARTLPQ